MSVDVITEIVIDRPVAEVSTYARDPSNAPIWYANIDTVEWKTPPPAQIGSQVALVARFLGRRLVYTYELVELVPGDRLVMRTHQGPFPMETTYTWTATSNGSDPHDTAQPRTACRVHQADRCAHGSGRPNRELGASATRYELTAPASRACWTRPSALSSAVTRCRR